MRKAIGWGLQLQRRMVRKIKLERLMKSGVGTGKVEKLALKLALEMRGGRRGQIEERERKTMVRKKVLLLMRDKVKDATEDADLAFTQFCKSKQVIWKIIVWDSRMGAEFREVMRGEMVHEWKERTKAMQKTVDYLVKKHRMLRSEVVPEEWRGIKISDQALGDRPPIPPPFLGEDVRELSAAAKEVLQMPPKTALYSKIRIEDIQMEIGKAVDAKARWTDMEMQEREGNAQTREEAEEEERLETEVYDRQRGTLDMAKMRVTSLPTNKEVFLPEERSNEVESKLQAFSAEITEVAKNYIRENVDKQGNVKESNLTKTQAAGLKELESLIKNKDVIVTKTDKSGRQCVLTEDEYVQMGEQHVSGDVVKNRDEMEKIEDNLNCHALQFCRLLGLCDGNNCARRLKSALLNQNTLPPSLYFTVKDHKPIVPGAPLPARPVCGAIRAHNGQLGYMLVKVLDREKQMKAFL